ncbi:SDR family oxidoreductase [Mucilaginibacter aquariorum]|uniref:SDR family oxidoreductase n=1 Tax=Mucilaginibacter aquariorum TaxID=2967225 RepID=A0ABT1T7S8_9SPHI|nr:SDR family oxidoreductase [Mucilaginibacter aquariorum]MCQ6960657.1 SDR family oxidoreductase [Mucilaginibacter aquariorum]
MKNQKVALITGANRGIGFETAKQLGEQGVTVILTARTLETANEAADKLKQQGIDAYGINLEVTNAGDRKAVAKYIEDKFGKLDILINNAGVNAKDSGLFEARTIETTEEEFQYVFGTNLFSVVFLTKELLPLIKKSEAGRIVNLSSILGSLTLHAQKDSPIESLKKLSYDASKAALNMFTNHLAIELEGTGIKVNSAHPGWVKTPLGGDSAPMEIADGAKTSVQLALIGEDGPNGKFIHLGEELPW